jgi:hypothetical protein
MYVQNITMTINVAAAVHVSGSNLPFRDSNLGRTGSIYVRSNVPADCGEPTNERSLQRRPARDHVPQRCLIFPSLG